MKKFIYILIGVVIVCTISSILIINATGKEPKKIIYTENQIVDIKIDNIIINKVITVSKFKVYYFLSKNLWTFEMYIRNDSLKVIDLNEYEIFLYDKDDNEILKIDGNLVHFVDAFEEYPFTYDTKTDLINVTNVKIIPKIKDLSDNA